MTFLLSLTLLFMLVSLIPDNTYSFYIIVALIFLICDTFLGVAERYFNDIKNNKPFGSSVKSKNYIVGIVLKIFFISILLIFSALVDKLTETNIFKIVFFFYYTYEIKSIDEHITNITGKSIINTILKAFFFFKSIKKNIEK